MKEDTWLKGLSTESRFELRLVVDIATAYWCLDEGGPRSEVPALVEAAAYRRRLTITTKVEIVRILVCNS